MTSARAGLAALNGGLLAALLLAAAAASCGGPEEPPPAPSPSSGAPEAGSGAPEVALPVAPPPGAESGAPPLLERSPYYVFQHARMEAETDAQGRPLGVRVISVQPGGRVALAGIEPGDLIFYIDGIKLDDPANFPNAVRLVEDVFLRGRPQRIHIVRDGRRTALIPLQPLRTRPAAPDSGESPPPPPR